MSVLTYSQFTGWWLERQLHRLITLPQCSRCQQGKCEKCLDMGWQCDYLDSGLPDITCSCGCWSRFLLLGDRVWHA